MRALTFIIAALRPMVPIVLGPLGRRSAAYKGRRTWTSEEDAQLRKLVTEKRSNAEIHRFFPDRTLDSVGARGTRLRRELGILAPHFWSDDEISIVEQSQASGSPMRDTFGSLPSRSLTAKYSILAKRRCRNRELNNQKRLTAEDVEKIRHLREESQLTWEKVGEMMQRNSVTVRGFYIRHTTTANVRKACKWSKWTDADTNRLRHLIMDGTTDMDIAKQMSYSLGVIRRMRAELFHRDPDLLQKTHWSSHDDQLLHDASASGLAAKQIQTEVLPQRSLSAIHMRLHWLRLLSGKSRKQSPAWNADEDKVLQDASASGLAVKHIQTHLLPHRTVSAVHTRLRRMRLATDPSNAPSAWSLDEDNLLQDGLASGMKAKQIHAEVLSHRTLPGVKARIHKLRIRDLVRGKTSASSTESTDAKSS